MVIQNRISNSAAAAGVQSLVWVCWLVILCLVFHPGALYAQSEQRVALVIGNSRYPDRPLINPKNDATDVSALLKDQLGFDTSLVVDADKSRMEQKIREFIEVAEYADVRLFYFAGHGISVGESNFLIPIGADIDTEEDVRWEALSVSQLLESLERLGSGTNIIVLDACRDNPLSRSTRSATRGLYRMAAPMGSLILYATAPGQVAEDGRGRNGTFTKYLLRSLAAPDVHLGDIAMDVRVAVMEETKNRQIPWSESSLTRRIYLAGKSGQQSVGSNQVRIADTDSPERLDTTGSTPSGESPDKPSLADSDEYSEAMLSAYMLAARTGDAIAQSKLAYIFDVGRFALQDKEMAVVWYERAIDQRQWDAAVNLAVLYLNGDGVAKNSARAVELLNQAADHGHAVAQQNLGVLYQYGEVVPRDYAKAKVWFEKAAETGNVDALVSLGDVYSRGLGTQVNEQLAFNWYMQAARLNSPEAQTEVGYMYDEGLGVSRDLDKAFEWYRRSAEQDYALGVYNLAEMHELGKGTGVDLAAAKKLYRKAFELGYSQAADALNRLEN